MNPSRIFPPDVSKSSFLQLALMTIEGWKAESCHLVTQSGSQWQKRPKKSRIGDYHGLTTHLVTKIRSAGEEGHENKVRLPRKTNWGSAQIC